MLGRVVALPRTTAERLAETALVYTAFLLPALLAGPAGDTTTDISSALLPVALSALPQVGLVLYILVLRGEAERPELGLRRPRWADLARGSLLLAALLGILGAAELLLSFLPEPLRESLTQGARFRLSAWHDIPAAVALCALAAVREEVLYRSYLYVRLVDLGVPSLPALVSVSMLFAAAHAYQGAIAVGLALAQGLALGAAFARVRSITVPVVAHAGHNLIVLIWTLLSAA